jgi:hypothetical protein
VFESPALLVLNPLGEMKDIWVKICPKRRGVFCREKAHLNDDGNHLPAQLIVDVLNSAVTGER